MTESGIDNLMPGGYNAPQSDSKRQKLRECILTRNSKLYLGKVYTEEQINKLSDEEVDKLFNNYEAKLSGQMVVFGKINHQYVFNGSLCSFRNKHQDALSEDLEKTLF